MVQRLASFAKASVIFLLATCDSLLLIDFRLELWETADMGQVESARAIEPLCQLWCLPGLRGGAWTHAFKLLKL